MLDNRISLKKHKIIYPENYQVIFGHHNFRDKLEKRTLTDSDVQYLSARSETVVLSSEDFISLNKKDFEYLRDSLPKTKIIVIYSWRRSSYKLYSIWQEVIKHGGVESFFEYYHSHIARPGHSQMLSADLKVAIFCHVFGKNNVKIIDYDASLKNDTLIEDFVSLFGVDSIKDYVRAENNPDALNRSLDKADVEILRSLNCIFEFEFELPKNRIRIAYLKHQNSKLKLKIEELKAIISMNCKEIEIGNYFIDIRCESIMSDKFRANIVNYEKSLQAKKIKIPSDIWRFKPSANKLLNEIAVQIKVLIQDA